MELKEILAISGQPGLYKYVAQSKNGVIVESLLDGRRMNAAANAKVSALTEISMFTEGDDIALADSSVNLTIRAWVKNSDYWNVFFEHNEEFYKELPKHGLSFPFPQMDVHVKKE